MEGAISCINWGWSDSFQNALLTNWIVQFVSTGPCQLLFHFLKCVLSNMPSLFLATAPQEPDFAVDLVAKVNLMIGDMAMWTLSMKPTRNTLFLECYIPYYIV